MVNSLRLHFVERYDEQWMINQEGYGSNPEICQQKQMLGSCSTRFSKYVPDFMGFKRFCSGVLQNLVRDAASPRVFLCQ